MGRRKKVTASEFERISTEEVLARFGPLGFTKYRAGAYKREMEGFWQGFAVCAHSSMMWFWVPVGLLVPSLWKYDDLIMGPGSQGFKISHRLGEFHNNCTEAHRNYHFYTEEELRACFDEVYRDYMEQAQPWLDQFATLEQVVTEYYRYRIGPLPGSGAPPPQPFVWASYGWMLEELGRADEAVHWFQRAYDQVCQPTYMKDGRLVAVWSKGATDLGRSEEEERLKTLLEKSLGLPSS